MLEMFEMFEKNSFTYTLPKKEYKAQIGGLETRLAELQRKIIDWKIPVLIVFEGWSASGKGTCISKIMYPLDPRYFNVYTMNKIPEDAAMRPLLWNYWVKIPSKGEITIFDKSWHRAVLPERQKKRPLSHDEKKNFYYDAEAFERQLSDDGTLIIKFFLNISKEEQKRRFDALLGTPEAQWRVKEHDLLQNKNYGEYAEHFKDMIKRSNFSGSQWNIIESDDINYASVKIYKIIINKIEGAIKQIEDGIAAISSSAQNMPENCPRTLNLVNPNQDISKEEYKEKLRCYQKKLSRLEYKMYAKRKPVIIVYEGQDASGKGGNIRRMTQRLDPRGYEVTPVAAPTQEELAHHYLWRFWKAMPKNGHIAVFDRSWYGRVLVERAEGFCSDEEWRRAYKEINDMEMHLHSHGAVIFKFWLQIDKDEQLARFREREADPLKQYKITADDWRNREKWDVYEEAADEMLFRTNTDYAPWTVVEANNKRYARIKTLKIVADTLEEKLK